MVAFLSSEMLKTNPFQQICLLLISIHCLSGVLTAPCLLDDFEARQTTNVRKESETEESDTLTTTTTESPIKSAAKNLADAFHKMSQKVNATFSGLATTSGFRNGRSGILRLPGSDDDSELKDILGIHLPPPMDLNSLRNKFKALPTPSNIFKPQPEMHTFGVSGLLSDGNLHDLASGR